MDELISDALRFARGTREVPQEIEVQPFVEEILASYEQAVTLTMSVPSSHRAQVAPSAFRRVLINLVSNGCQHGGKVNVVIEADYIRVIDDGPGIPDEYREQVFQPFFRLDSSRSAATGGSGLGLAIVQQLCQAHGWQIGIDSAPQGGTEVWLKYAAIS